MMSRENSVKIGLNLHGISVAGNKIQQRVSLINDITTKRAYTEFAVTINPAAVTKT